MTDKQTQALREFALQHGAEWKTALYQFYLTGKDSGALRQIRNNHLPLVMSKQFTIEGV